MHLLPDGFLLLSLQLQQTLTFSFAHTLALGFAYTLALSFLFVKNNLINAY
jgi:hypothetical protein